MIDFSTVKLVKLDKLDFKKIKTENEYSLVYVDKNNYINYYEELSSVADCIKRNLPDWDIKLKPDDIIERFNLDSHCLLFNYKNKCVGWNWGSTIVKFDWITEVKKLPEGVIYFGGCFVCKESTPPDAGLINFNYIFDYWLNTKKFKTVVGCVDNWNKASLRVCLQNNLRIENWVDDN